MAGSASDCGLRVEHTGSPAGLHVPCENHPRCGLHAWEHGVVSECAEQTVGGQGGGWSLSPGSGWECGSSVHCWRHSHGVDEIPGRSAETEEGTKGWPSGYREAEGKRSQESGGVTSTMRKNRDFRPEGSGG